MATDLFISIGFKPHFGHRGLVRNIKAALKYLSDCSNKDSSIDVCFPTVFDFTVLF